MNAALLSTLGTEKATEVKKASATSLGDIVTLGTMYLATSAVVLLLALTWIL